MTRIRRWWSVIVAATTAGVLGCGETAVTQPEDGTAIAVEGPMLQSAAGLQVSEARMKSILADVTRAVAMALADQSVRTAVYDGLHASPYRENKVQFRTFLQQQGRPLLGAMAAARGLAKAGVLARLDSILDLEFYMPVPEHWQAWDGGPDLIVASVLRDNGMIPRAFDLAGKEVVLQSAKDPPSTPTLSIVPVETDFSRTPAGPQPGPSHASSVTGVYMTLSHIANIDDYEGFLHGQPELEIHAFVQNPVTGQFEDKACAGADQTSPYYFNQDDDWWSGEVLVVTDQLIDTNEVEIQVWEDDTGPCTPSGGRPPDPVSNIWPTIGAFAATIVTVAKTIEGSTEVSEIASIVATIPVVYATNGGVQADDSVGLVSGPTAGCWEATGSVPFQVRMRSTGYVAGSLNLDYRFGDRRTPLCPLDASIVGPSLITITNGIPDPYPIYVAEVSGGIGTISYQWWDNNDPVGTTSSYEMSPVTVGLHTIHLQVTRGTETVHRYLDMEVSEGGGCNPDCAPKRSDLKAVSKPARPER